jgi:diacylglycerol kinase (ATP)
MSDTGTCVIFNPTAGRGRARHRLESLRRFLGGKADFRPTRYPRHGEELARQAAIEGFPRVAAAGGDGTVHDVANGLLRSGRSDVTLVVYPIGSANDYAHSLGLGPEWWRNSHLETTVRRLDVGRAMRADGRDQYFVNGLGLGFNGAVTLESRRVLGLQGVPLYTVALLRALYYHYNYPSMTLEVDGQTWRTPTLALTLALGRREGNFVLAPDAKLDDGLFDYVHAGRFPGSAFFAMCRG